MRTANTKNTIIIYFGADESVCVCAGATAAVPSGEIYALPADFSDKFNFAARFLVAKLEMDGHTVCIYVCFAEIKC